ncbi:hypothetical protein GOBAR_AA35795 [Gossypium barbadense]|uniref:Uncharacterized protein n=1 Tax=Gossypium barbadense TaxID=3634 RepID=A0A2P5W1H9_GOSBA|nr:hypothetical protein GOBAR_AA35795 [Gossypium barbadense]
MARGIVIPNRLKVEVVTVVEMLHRERQLLTKHHKYEFNIPKGSHHVSKVFGPDSTGRRPQFFLSLFLLEAGFTIPFLDFIQDVLYYFNVVPN